MNTPPKKSSRVNIKGMPAKMHLCQGEEPITTTPGASSQWKGKETCTAQHDCPTELTAVADTAPVATLDT